MKRVFYTGNVYLHSGVSGVKTQFKKWLALSDTSDVPAKENSTTF